MGKNSWNFNELWQTLKLLKKMESLGRVLNQSSLGEMNIESLQTQHACTTIEVQFVIRQHSWSKVQLQTVPRLHDLFRKPNKFYWCSFETIMEVS